MGTRNNYEDNLFFLQAWLKTLRMIAKLDLDVEIFLHKVVDIILFIHESLSKMHQKLVSNTQYIHRSEHLHMLLLAKMDFISFLDSILQDKTEFLDQLASCRDQLVQCREIHQQESSEINDILDEQTVGETEETDIISSDEYRYLFKDQED